MGIILLLVEKSGILYATEIVEVKITPNTLLMIQKCNIKHEWSSPAPGKTFTEQYELIKVQNWVILQHSNRW